MDDRTIAHLASARQRIADLEKMEQAFANDVARASTAAGLSIPDATPTTIAYEITDLDPKAVFTGTAYVPQSAGIYRVSAFHRLASPEACELHLYHNGLPYSILDKQTFHAILKGQDLIYLAGDGSSSVQIVIVQTSGGAIALTADATCNYFNVFRVP